MYIHVQENCTFLLQDGTFSLSDYMDLWSEPEVQRLLSAYKGDIKVSMHCTSEGGWTQDRLDKEHFSRMCQVTLNESPVQEGHNAGVTSFVEYLSAMLVAAPVHQMLETSEIVGNIRFSRPTLYVFPGGQGDAALFGINGFNMLIDGGFARKACFWDFTRHLDRLDAVLLTRVNNNSVGGLGAVIQRKVLSQAYPQIGHFFGNVVERRHGKDGEQQENGGENGGAGGGDQLLISLQDEGQRIFENLRSINLKPHLCFRENVIEPINLYHKVGHGKLDLYILNPAKDSREVKEFLTRWYTEKGTPQGSKVTLRSSASDGKDFQFPVLNLVSICALLVWQPANPRDSITRLLFPGSTPQYKIFEALQKLKHLEFLRFPVCSAKTIAASHKSKLKSEKLVSEAKSQLTKATERAQSSHPPATVARAPSATAVPRSISSSRTVATPPSLSRDEVQSKEDLLEQQNKRRRPQSHSRSRTNVANEAAPKQPVTETKPPIPHPRTSVEKTETTSRPSRTSAAAAKPPAKTGPTAQRTPSATRAPSTSRPAKPQQQQQQQQPHSASPKKVTETKLKRPAMLPKSNEAKKPAEAKPIKMKAVSSRIDTGKNDTAKPVIEPRKRPTTAAPSNRIPQKVSETAKKAATSKPVKEVTKAVAGKLAAGAVAPAATKIPTPPAEEMEPQIIAVKHESIESEVKTNGVNGVNGSNGNGIASVEEIVDGAANEAEEIEAEEMKGSQEEEQPQSLPSSCYPPLESGSELSSLDHISIEEDEEEPMQISQHSTVSTSKETEEGPTEHVVGQGHGGMESEQEEEDEYLVVEKDEVTDNTNTTDSKLQKGGEDAGDQMEEDERAATPLVVTDPQELPREEEPDIDGEETPEIRSPVKRSIAGVGDVEQDSLEEPVPSRKDEITEVPTPTAVDGDDVEVIRAEATEAAQLQRNVSELNVPDDQLRESSQEPPKFEVPVTKADSVEPEEITLEKVDSVPHVPEEEAEEVKAESAEKVDEAVPEVKDLEPSTEILESKPSQAIEEVAAEEREPQVEEGEAVPEESVKAGIESKPAGFKMDKKEELEGAEPKGAVSEEIQEDVPVTNAVAELRTSELEPAEADVKMPEPEEIVSLSVGETVPEVQKTVASEMSNPEESAEAPFLEPVAMREVSEVASAIDSVAQHQPPESFAVRDSPTPPATELPVEERPRESEERQIAPKVQEVPEVAPEIMAAAELDIATSEMNQGITEQSEATALDVTSEPFAYQTTDEDQVPETLAPAQQSVVEQVTSAASVTEQELPVPTPMASERPPVEQEQEEVVADAVPEIEPSYFASTTESKTESDQPASVPAVIQEPELEPLEVEPKPRAETVAMDISEDLDEEPPRSFENLEPTSLGDQQIVEPDDDEVATTETDVPLDQQSIISEAGTEPEEDKAAFMEFQNSRGSVSSLRDELQSARKDSFEFDPVTHKSILVTEEPADSLSVEINTTDQNVISDSLASEKQEVVQPTFKLDGAQQMPALGEANDVQQVPEPEPNESEQVDQVETSVAAESVTSKAIESDNDKMELPNKDEQEPTEVGGSDIAAPSESALLTAGEPTNESEFALDEGTAGQFTQEIPQLGELQKVPLSNQQDLITADKKSDDEPITAPAGDMLHVKGDVPEQPEPIIPDLPEDEMPSEPLAERIIPGIGLHQPEGPKPELQNDLSTDVPAAPVEVPQPQLEAIKSNDDNVLAGETPEVESSLPNEEGQEEKQVQVTPADEPLEPEYFKATSVEETKSLEPLSDEDSNKVAAEVESIITTAEVETSAAAALNVSSRKTSREEPPFVSEVRTEEPEAVTEFQDRTHEDVEPVKFAGEEVHVPTEALRSLEEHIIPEVKGHEVGPETKQVEASMAAAAETEPETVKTAVSDEVPEKVSDSPKTEPDQDIMATAELAALAAQETDKDIQEDQKIESEAVQDFQSPRSFEATEIASSLSPPPSPEILEQEPLRKESVQSVHEEIQIPSAPFENQETVAVASEQQKEPGTAPALFEKALPETALVPEHVPDTEPAFTTEEEQGAGRLAEHERRSIDSIPNDEIPAEHVAATPTAVAVAEKEKVSTEPQSVEKVVELTERDDKVSSPPAAEDSLEFSTEPLSIRDQVAQIAAAVEETLPQSIDTQLGQFELQNREAEEKPAALKEQEHDKSGAFGTDADLIPPVSHSITAVSEQPGYYNFEQDLPRRGSVAEVQEQKPYESFTSDDRDASVTATFESMETAEVPIPETTAPGKSSTEGLVSKSLEPEETGVALASEVSPLHLEDTVEGPIAPSGEKEVLKRKSIDLRGEEPKQELGQDEQKFKIPTVDDPELEQLIRTARSESPIPEPETKVSADDFLADVIEPVPEHKRQSIDTPQVEVQQEVEAEQEPNETIPKDISLTFGYSAKPEAERRSSEDLLHPEPKPLETEVEVFEGHRRQSEEVPTPAPTPVEPEIVAESASKRDSLYEPLDAPAATYEQVSPGTLEASIERLHGEIDRVLDLAQTNIDEGLKEVEEMKSLDTETQDKLEHVLEQAQTAVSEGLHEVEEIKAMETPTRRSLVSSPEPAELEVPETQLLEAVQQEEERLEETLHSVKTELDKSLNVMEEIKATVQVPPTPVSSFPEFEPRPEEAGEAQLQDLNKLEQVLEEAQAVVADGLEEIEQVKAFEAPIARSLSPETVKVVPTQELEEPKVAEYNMETELEDAPEPALPHLDKLEKVLDQAQTAVEEGLETVHEVYTIAPDGLSLTTQPGMVPAGVSPEMVAESGIFHDVKCQQETMEPVAATTTTVIEGVAAGAKDEEETRERADRMKEFIATSDVMIAVKDGMEKLLLRDSDEEAKPPPPHPAADLSSLPPSGEGQEEEVEIEQDSQDKDENKFIRPLPYEETLDSQEGIEHLLREARALATIKEYELRHEEKIPSAIPPKLPREAREVIRTPDEVADLPVHEEVDPTTYETDDVVINDVDSIICQRENDEPAEFPDKATGNAAPLTADSVPNKKGQEEVAATFDTTASVGAVKGDISPLELPEEHVEKPTAVDQPQHALPQEPEIQAESQEPQQRETPMLERAASPEINETEIITAHSMPQEYAAIEASNLGQHTLEEREQSNPAKTDIVPQVTTQVPEQSLALEETASVEKPVEVDQQLGKFQAEPAVFEHAAEVHQSAEQPRQSSPQPLSLEPAESNRLPEPVKPTTSVVITPSTPPVVVHHPDSASSLGKSDFDYEEVVASPSAVTGSDVAGGDNAEEKQVEPEEKAGRKPDTDSDFLSKSSPLTQDESAERDVSAGPANVVEEEEETAVSQAVIIPSSSTEIEHSAQIQAAEETREIDRAVSSSPPPVQGQKLFTLPGADDDEDEESSSEKSEPTERNGMGAICSGLLTAAATLSAAVISQSAENLATLPSGGEEEETTFNDKPQQEQEELSPAAVPHEPAGTIEQTSSPTTATTTTSNYSTKDAKPEQPEPSMIQRATTPEQVEVEAVETSHTDRTASPIATRSADAEAEVPAHKSSDELEEDIARPDETKQIHSAPTTPPPQDKQEKTESAEQTVTISELPAEIGSLVGGDTDRAVVLAGHELTHELSTMEHSQKSETEQVATFSSQSFSSSSTTRDISQVIQSVHREAASVIIKHEHHHQPDAKMDTEEEHISKSVDQQHFHHEIIMDESGSYSSGEFSDSQFSTVHHQRRDSLPEDNSNVNQLIRQHHFGGEPSVSSAQDVANGNYPVGPAGGNSVVVTTTTKSGGENGNFMTTTITTTMTPTSSENKPEEVSAAGSMQGTGTGAAAAVTEADDILKAWGKPLGLPPAQIDPTAATATAVEGQSDPQQPQQQQDPSSSKTPRKDKSVDRAGAAGGSRSSASATPAKHHSSGGRAGRSHHRSTKHLSPVYLDLAYVPHHGNANYCDSEFFRLVRSRYYVFSGLEPSRQVFDGLLEGKQQWEDKKDLGKLLPFSHTFCN